MNIAAEKTKYPESSMQRLYQSLMEEEPKWFELRKKLARWIDKRKERQIGIRAYLVVGSIRTEHMTSKELQLAGYQHVGNIIDYDMIPYIDVCLNVVAMVANQEGITQTEALSNFEMFAQEDYLRGKNYQGSDATCWARPKENTVTEPDIP